MNLNNLLTELTNEVENPCWDGYEMRGTKMKDGKKVPNCVPKNESLMEASIKAIHMLFQQKGVKDAIRQKKVDQIRKAIEGEGISTKKVSDDEILQIAKELSESVNEGAYQNATKNELAQYIINLTNELKSAKAENDKTKIKYLERDIKEVKDALAKKKNESLMESSIKTIQMLFQNKGMKDAIRKEKVDQIRKAIEGEGISTKKVSDSEILQIAKELSESVKNESVYSNQTGIKSAMLGVPNFSNLLNPKEFKWISKSDVKIFKNKGFFIFTDGKREMIVSKDGDDFKILKTPGRISKVTKDLYNENINEAIDSKKLLSIYNGLKKGDKITIKYNSSISSNNEKTFIVTSGKRTVGKAKVERITMVVESNPKGVKFYLYNRNGNVSLAIGNMAASIVSVNESINEAKFKAGDIVKYKSGKSKAKVLKVDTSNPEVTYDMIWLDTKKKFSDGESNLVSV